MGSGTVSSVEHQMKFLHWVHAQEAFVILVLDADSELWNIDRHIEPQTTRRVSPSVSHFKHSVHEGAEAYWVQEGRILTLLFK